MRNYVQPGSVLTVPAPAGGVAAGDPVLIGNLFGIAATTEAAGDPVEVSTTGVFIVPKAVVAATLGAVAYLDAAAGKVTTDDNTGSKVVFSATQRFLADRVFDLLETEFSPSKRPVAFTLPIDRVIGLRD